MATNGCSNGNGDKAAGVVVPEIKFTKLFINGEFVDAVSGKTFETWDPRTGDVLAHIAEADQAEVDLAVKAARDAFEHGKWPRMSGYERGRIMNKFADLVEQHTEELAALDGADAGKLLLLGKIIDIPAATQMLRYYAGAADKIHGEVLRVSGKYQGHTLKEPYRRRRRHHPLELPDHDVLPQGHSGPRRRLHRRRQARRADAALRALLRPPRQARRRSGRGDQRRARVRSHRRRRRGVAHGRRQRGVHGVDGGWTPDHGVGGEEQPEDGVAGARRQVAADHLRRRRRRHGRQPVTARHLLQQGRGLRGRVACIRAGRDLRRVRQEGGGGGAELEGWGSFRCHHQHGSSGGQGPV